MPETQVQEQEDDLDVETVLEEEVEPEQSLVDVVRQFSGEAPKVVATALLNHAHPVYQSIFNAGLSKGEEQEKARTQKESAAAAALRKEVQERDRRIRALTSEAPEKDQTITEQATRIAELEKQVEDITTQHTQEKIGTRKETVFGKLQAALAGPGGLRDDIARYKAMDPEIRARLRFSEDATAHEALQAGRAIPMPVPKGKEGWEVLAEEIIRDAAPGDRKPRMERGSGQFNTAGAIPGAVSDAEAAERKRQTLGYGF